MLRAWHVGQDAQLRFFDSTSGITDTNLQVGTAHRIDLTLGPSGARIYLDGAPLTNGFILANQNGWNNARIKHLGMWTDGVTDGADGAFDHFRIWHRELTSAQIADLEPAQSITLPGAPQPAQELSVPSLGSFLKNDQTNPPPTKYVSNQTRGNGSGSSPANAQELQAASMARRPVMCFQAVCQTPGTIEFWDCPNGIAAPTGNAGNYITLEARQGDGIVLSRAEDFAGARTPNSGYWTQERAQPGGHGQAHLALGRDGERRRPDAVWLLDRVRSSASAVPSSEHGESARRIWYGEQPNAIIPGRWSTRTPIIGSTSDAASTSWQVQLGNKWSNHIWPGHPEAFQAVRSLIRSARTRTIT